MTWLEVIAILKVEAESRQATGEDTAAFAFDKAADYMTATIDTEDLNLTVK